MGMFIGLWLGLDTISFGLLDGSFEGIVVGSSVGIPVVGREVAGFDVVGRCVGRVGFLVVGLCVGIPVVGRVVGRRDVGRRDVGRFVAGRRVVGSRVVGRRVVGRRVGELGLRLGREDTSL